MSDVATPDQIVIEPDTPESAPTLPVLQHAKQFSAEARAKAAEEAATAPPEAPASEELKPIRPVDQQKREQGKFAEGRKPMKAKDAVERINQLTGRAKTAEEKLAAAEAELTRLRSERATPAQIARAEQKVEQAEATVEGPHGSDFSEAEPQEDDPKFANDYGKYLRAVSAWEGRKAFHDARLAERQREAQHQREQADRAVLKTWAGRVDTARTKYEDFDAVALGPTKIREGSPIDAFIMEDDNGTDVLYHLHAHPQELDEMLGMTPLMQLKRLALLSQRFSSSPPAAAGLTGSAPERKVIVQPKPPNPVRTDAQRVSEVPPTDGTLSVMRHAKAFQRR